MFILDTYTDTWNYTFIVIAIISIGIGAYLAIKNMGGSNLKSRREKRNKNK